MVFMTLIVVKTVAQKAGNANAPAIDHAINTVITMNVSTSVHNNDQEVQIADDPQRSKTFSKTFSIDHNDKINLNNQYGSIVIRTWDRKEFKVDVDIKAYSNSDNDAQKLIDAVTIDANKSGDVVSVKTNLAEQNGHYGSSIKNGIVKWRREVKINYVVYMPSSNSLTASQTYGNITIDDFAGPTVLKVQYGNLMVGSLNNSNNNISVQYGKATIKNVNQAKIKHQYGSGLTIGTIGIIDLDAQYTGVNITTIKGAALIKHQYGNGLNIGSVSALSLSAQYTNVKIGSINGNTTAKIQYGKFNLDRLESGCKNLDVSSSYGSVRLGFDTNYNANFEVSTSYGGFSYDNNVTLNKNGGESRQEKTNYKNYSGIIGKGSSNTNISVKAQYGSTNFQ